MRSFTADGSLCWCDGPVLDQASWNHDPDCMQAREARPILSRNFDIQEH
jgi:hypothetical protein